MYCVALKFAPSIGSSLGNISAIHCCNASLKLSVSGKSSAIGFALRLRRFPFGEPFLTALATLAAAICLLYKRKKSLCVQTSIRLIIAYLLEIPPMHGTEKTRFSQVKAIRARLANYPLKSIVASSKTFLMTIK
jgi:hypothetical protein